MSCNSASTRTPLASASLASGLDSDFKSSVSAGSICLSRKPSPSVTRNCSANLRAFLITSLVFGCMVFLLLPTSAQGFVKLHYGQQFIAVRLGQTVFRVEQVPVRI